MNHTQPSKNIAHVSNNAAFHSDHTIANSKTHATEGLGRLSNANVIKTPASQPGTVSKLGVYSHSIKSPSSTRHTFSSNFEPVHASNTSDTHRENDNFACRIMSNSGLNHPTPSAPPAPVTIAEPEFELSNGPSDAEQNTPPNAVTVQQNDQDNQEVKRRSKTGDMVRGISLPLTVIPSAFLATAGALLTPLLASISSFGVMGYSIANICDHKKRLNNLIKELQVAETEATQCNSREGQLEINKKIDDINSRISKVKTDIKLLVFPTVVSATLGIAGLTALGLASAGTIPVAMAATIGLSIAGMNLINYIGALLPTLGSKKPD